MTAVNFASLGLKPELLTAINAMGYQRMTPIQANSISPILRGNDILAQARTGSGKTAAFAIGVLSKVDPRKQSMQALIICPTRELATQVAQEMRRLASQMANLKVLVLSGGVPVGPQRNSLEHGAHIIVGTPGRLEDFLFRRWLNLKNVHTLVLDEADRMLDMGFEESLEKIFEKIPKNRQTLLFSATFPERIKTIAHNLLTNPIEVKGEAEEVKAPIVEVFIPTEREKRVHALVQILKACQPESAIVFCTTKIQCKEVAEALRGQGIKALEIHGDLLQPQRDETLILFANKSHSVLIATDVAARGLDIADLELVINFEIAKLPETHTHRIGRTGRAGRKGLAISLFSKNEVDRIERIESKYGKVKKSALADFIHSLSGAPEGMKTLKSMTTILLNAGKKDKIRSGDILGALTAGAKIEATEIGKINILDFCSYVAVASKISKEASQFFQDGKIKGRLVKARLIT